VKFDGLRRSAVLLTASVMALAGVAAAATPAGAAPAGQRAGLTLAASNPLDGCFWEAQDPSYRSSTNMIRFRGQVVCPTDKHEITIIIGMLINTGSGEQYANQAIETYTDTNSAPISLFHPCIGAGGSVEKYRTAIRIKIYHDGHEGEVSLNSKGSLTYDCSPF
jgi:hypothetical protein